MKAEYLTMVIVVVATAATSAGPTHSPAAMENRYSRAGNRATVGRATDFQRENPAASAARKNVPFPNGESSDRWRRANLPWDGEHSEYQTFTRFSLWRPPVYQLSRPYFIPIYGSSGRIPIYFAPQPFDQSGYDKPPFMGPPYLPPKEYPPKEYLPPTTQPPVDTTMTVKSRFDFDDDDDRPIWDGGFDNDLDEKISNKLFKSPGKTVQEIIKNVFELKNPILTTTESLTQTLPSTTHHIRKRRSAANSTQAPSVTAEQSSFSLCVWAIISCCSTEKEHNFSLRCFEARGCPGPFWGTSPCSNMVIKTSAEAALKYYSSV